MPWCEWCRPNAKESFDCGDRFFLSQQMDGLEFRFQLPPFWGKKQCMFRFRSLSLPNDEIYIHTLFIFFPFLAPQVYSPACACLLFFMIMMLLIVARITMYQRDKVQ